MGHTHHTYGEFGDDLVRPLYGYVTKFRDGEVPMWAKKPTVSESKMADMLDLPSKYKNGIPRGKLPKGVKKDSGGRGPTRYKVRREKFLELHRERIQTADRKIRYEHAEFDLEMGTGYTPGHVQTVPDEIIERLNAVRGTSYWDRKVDGYHVGFSGWKLVYTIGARGGIQDVHIKADLNH